MYKKWFILFYLIVFANVIVAQTTVLDIIKSSIDSSIDRNDSINIEIEKGDFQDSRDGQVYNWVKIGDQVWMADNLRYHSGKFISNSKDWKKNYKNGNLAACCWYDDNSYYAKKYGAFYNYPAAKNSCPDNWELPSYDDWYKLIFFLSNNRYPTSQEIKVSYEDIWNSVYIKIKDKNKDIYGFFNITPGRRSWKGEFYGENSGSWWSSKEIGSSSVVGLRYLDANALILRLYSSGKSSGLNVRCIKDKD